MVASMAGALPVGVLHPAGAPAAQEIRIGSVNPLTGRFAPHGNAIHQGIALAVEEANAGPDSPGARIVLLARDDEGKPERAVGAAEELLGRHEVAALVGGYVDNLVGPVSEVAERHRAPYVATASLDERLAQRGHRYFFRISNLQGYVEPTAGAIQDLLRPRTVAILYSTTPGAAQLARRQRDRLLRAGIAVPVYEGFTAGAADFTLLLLRLREARVEFLLSNAFFPDHLLMVRQLRGLDIPLKGFLGTFGMEFPEVVAELGPASEHLLGTTGWEPGITEPGTEEASRAFVEAFRRRFGRDPPPLAMHGYAGARALIEAIRAAAKRGGPTREAVRDALARLDLLLPLGRVQFDERGDPRHYRRLLVQIRQGRHVVLYPPSRAVGAPIYPMPGWGDK